MTSLKRNSSLIHIFCQTLWLRQNLDGVCLRQLNTTHVESQLVRPHMPPCVHVQSSVTLSDLPLHTRSSCSARPCLYSRLKFFTCNVCISYSHLGSQLTWSTCLDTIPSPVVSSAIETYSVMFIENGPMCRSYRDIPNIPSPIASHLF